MCSRFRRRDDGVLRRAGGPELAGDLAISLETAARQAAQFGHSLRDEVRVLLLHGVLHLAGFDHEADSGRDGCARGGAAAASCGCRPA